jgi:hypothetical protein
MTKLIEGLLVNSAKLEKPFRLMVAGGSGSGKSYFVKTLIENHHFDSSFEEVSYVYPDYLDECPTEFNIPQNVQYIPGLPDLSYFTTLPNNSLVVLDDLMIESSKCENIAKLFTVVARKKNISIILIVQNIYQQGKQFRNIRLSASGIVLFKFYGGVDANYRLLRDIGMTSLLPKRLFEKIYGDRYQYIYLDLHPNRQNEFCSIRGNIFDNFYCIYYKMEYVAIPKADFLKYFKIIQAKKGKIKAVKNESSIKKKIKRKKVEKPSSEEEIESDIRTSSSESE